MSIPPQVETELKGLREGLRLTALTYWRDALGRGESSDVIKRLRLFVSALKTKEQGKRTKRSKRFIKPETEDWRF